MCFWVLLVSEGLVPLLCQVNFLEGHALDLLKGAGELLILVGKDSRLEEELLEPNEHSALLQVVSFLASIMD